MEKVYLAVDLGAGSGRVMAAVFDGKKIVLDEISRFDNSPVDMPDGLHWNITNLCKNMYDGIYAADRKYGKKIVSVGIDTWGVDYALIDKNGQLLGLPFIYRDARTSGCMEKVFAKTGKETLYNNTGIQFLFFNSIYQLFAHFKNSKELLKSADSLLFIPDYLSYALTGKKVIEESIASTSQLYNTAKHCWANSIISKLGFKKSLFKKAVAAPQNLGKIRKSLAANMTSNPSVICVAGHDTGSAVAAVPSAEKSPFWLSSGTWSIMGIELNKAVINADAYKYSFTNELGLCKTVRFSKNICGLWLMQECKRAWTQAGEKIGYEDMLRLAKNSAPFKYFIDPDAAEFAMPCDMPKKISDAIKKRYKKAPKDKGEILRCIYDSLSLKYAYVFEKLSKLSNTKPSTLHIIGGGSKDDLLCQFTANALNMQVLAGPAEATSLGNVAAQMIADKSVKDLKGARSIISASVKPKLYKPQNAQDFAKAYVEYKKQLKLS